MDSNQSSLAGKRAVVTGGARGIGAAVVRELAARGARVVAVHRGQRPADESAAQHAELLVAADLTDQAQVSDAFARIGGAGPIDVLVNAAGVFAGAPVGALSRADFDAQFDGNVWSVLLATQAALPHFPASGGRIVNFSSIGAQRPFPGTSLYAAAKAAVEALTQAWAQELGARGITVNAVAPGAVRTEMTAWMDEAMRAQVAAGTALGRFGEPQDIARVVAFLASADAGWVTGQLIGTDGGMR